MVINHLLNGMILQVLYFHTNLDPQISTEISTPTVWTHGTLNGPRSSNLVVSIIAKSRNVLGPGSVGIRSHENFWWTNQILCFFLWFSTDSGPWKKKITIVHRNLQNINICLIMFVIFSNDRTSKSKNKSFPALGSRVDLLILLSFNCSLLPSQVEFKHVWFVPQKLREMIQSDLHVFFPFMGGKKSTTYLTMFQHTFGTHTWPLNLYRFIVGVFAGGLPNRFAISVILFVVTFLEHCLRYMSPWPLNLYQPGL